QGCPVHPLRPRGVRQTRTRCSAFEPQNPRRIIVKITCPSCSAKYSIADEKVADRLAKIRCRKCGTTIVIDGKVDPANVYAADAAPEAGPGPASAGGAAAGEYSVDFGDNDQRNMTLDQLVTSYNAGEVTAETYIWTEGMDDWRP